MGNCTFGPGGKRADQDISQKLGDSRAILFSETFSEVCDTLHSPPPSSAKPLSLSSWGPRRLPGSSDFRRGSAEPDWGGAGAFRVTRKRPATGGSARNWLAGVSTGQWRGKASGRIGAAAGGRARDGGTHQLSAARCASARRSVPGPTALCSRPVPGGAWRRGSG